MWTGKDSHYAFSATRHGPHGNLDVPWAIGLLYRSADLVAVALSGVVSYTTLAGNGSADLGKLAVVVGVLLAIVMFPLAKVYGSWRGRSIVEQAGRLVLAWFSVIAILVLLAFLLGLAAKLDRVWLFGWLAGGAFLLVTFRGIAVGAVRTLRERGWNHKRVVVVGEGRWTQFVIERLREAGSHGLDVVAVVGEAKNSAPDSSRRADEIERLPSLVDDLKVDEVWICLPVLAGRQSEETPLDRVLKVMRHSTVTLRLVPNLSELRLMHRPMTTVAGVPVFDLNVSPMRIGVNRVLKAVEDRLFAVGVLLLSAPLFLIIAIAVKLSSAGPVLFKQVRHGWDGKPIKVYKFRTMRVHRERPGQVTQACLGDDRVTRVGALLRRTSLDELPQFFNVLQGRMSVVGPRPHAIEHNHYYMEQIDSYMQRHKVKPGITGWAQVNGFRGETNTIEKMRQRVEHDLFYIDNWSLAFDIKIILMTVVRGFSSPNAY